jgi:hypothetical protein
LNGVLAAPSERVPVMLTRSSDGPGAALSLAAVKKMSAPYWSTRLPTW